MKGLYLSRATYIMFENDPIVFNNIEMKKLKEYIIKTIRNNNKVDFLFSFKANILNNSHVSRNDENIKISDYSITSRNQILTFISNLKSMISNKKFKYIKENLMVHFY